LDCCTVVWCLSFFFLLMVQPVATELVFICSIYVVLTDKSCVFLWLGGRPVDVTDPKWDIYFIVKKIQDQPGDYIVELLGFTTVYRFYHYPDSTRFRVSQVYAFLSSILFLLLLLVSLIFIIILSVPNGMGLSTSLHHIWQSDSVMLIL